MQAKAIDWLTTHAKDENPFFMYLCFLKVHNPNNPSPRWKGKSPGGGTYLDALMELDDNTGQVVQAIRNLGLAENTLVVWTTDNGAWVDAWPDAGYTPFRGMKGSSFEGGFRVPAIAWWPGHIKGGQVNMDMWSHMDWWPTFAKLAGLEPPPHDWKDNDGKPIIFDGIDLSESLLGTGPGKRETFVYFNDQSFGGLRVKNYKTLFTAKDTWLGQDQTLKIPALYDLWWAPGEQYDIVFDGAAPTRGDFKTSPGRYSGQDNGWIGLYMTPVLTHGSRWRRTRTFPINPSALALTRLSRRPTGKDRDNARRKGRPLGRPFCLFRALLSPRSDPCGATSHGVPPMRRGGAGCVPTELSRAASHAKLARKLSKTCAAWLLCCQKSAECCLPALSWWHS
jgi:Sulfatase